MKLILAIVNDADIKELTDEMMKGGFALTKIGTSGGFLKARMTTVISAVSNEYLTRALDIIKSSTHKSKYSKAEATESAHAVVGTVPDEIVVGGATVFVLNIEECYKF